MSTGRLILAPQDPFHIVEYDNLLDTLTSIGLAGPAVEGRENAFFAGDDLMQLITFAGCSPFLRFEPESPEDDDFCHLQLTLKSEKDDPLFLSGETSKPPACPHCRKPVKGWQEKMASWRQSKGEWLCEGCGESNSPMMLNWRKYAGFGRTLVEIFSIFPGEAVPVPTLLTGLKENTGVGWIYFYIINPATK